MRQRKTFRSRWGFILACVGSAVGMANVWGFPYKLGMNGGGAFLLCYLFFIFIFSYTGLSSEYAIGRRSRSGTLGAYEYAWETRGKGGVGRTLGWIPLIGSVCIGIGYAVIISYVFKALTDSLFGTLMTVDAGDWFASFAFENFSVLPYHVIIVVVTALTLVLGADSIERTNKVMMPLFFVLFAILAIRVFFMPGSLEGYKFLFIPKWEYLLKPETWVWAMGQAFFSLSITGSGMIVYGSYLDDSEDIVAGAKSTAVFDTLAALVAALVMIPSAFAFGMDPASGPGLLFEILPTVLQQIPAGRVFAIILYLAVVFGGISSLQNMFEVVTESVLYKFKKLKRTQVLVGLSILTLAVGIFMEPIAETSGAILGGWGAWMDLVSIYIIPIGATLGALSWFWVLKKEDLLDEINKSARVVQGDRWHFVGKWIYTPLALLLCIIALAFKVAF